MIHASRPRFVVHLRVCTVLTCLLVAFLFGQSSLSERRYPGKSWEKARSAGEIGWSAEKLKRAREYSESIDTAAVVVVVDGIVLSEWGETTARYNCHSIRKSFLSALYGIHVKEGRIDLSKTLDQLGIDDNEPSLTAIEKQATILDLLKARSGVYHAALYESPGMKAARPARYSHTPGSFWYYNNWDFNALGTIFEQETRTRIFEEFKRRIAEPLEMEDFRLEDCAYFPGPDSIHPAYPFRMTARDMARFGLLFLRKGMWRGNQIVPAGWVQESTKSFSNAGHAGGYGYMWWVAVEGKHLPSVDLRDGVFSAQGAGGHYIVIVPYLDLVVVHRVNTDIRDRQVRGNEFGQLMRLILDARAAGPNPTN